MRDFGTIAKDVRRQLCLECECTFDAGCGCLAAITAALEEVQEATLADQFGDEMAKRYENGI